MRDENFVLMVASLKSLLEKPYTTFYIDLSCSITVFVIDGIQNCAIWWFLQVFKQQHQIIHIKYTVEASAVYHLSNEHDRLSPLPPSSTVTEEGGGTPTSQGRAASLAPRWPQWRTASRRLSRGGRICETLSVYISWRIFRAGRDPHWRRRPDGAAAPSPRTHPKIFIVLIHYLYLISIR